MPVRIPVREPPETPRRPGLVVRHRERRTQRMLRFSLIERTDGNVFRAIKGLIGG